jgi:hypothetical protein
LVESVGLPVSWHVVVLAEVLFLVATDQEVFGLLGFGSTALSASAMNLEAAGFDLDVWVSVFVLANFEGTRHLDQRAVG